MNHHSIVSSLGKYSIIENEEDEEESSSDEDICYIYHPYFHLQDFDRNFKMKLRVVSEDMF